MPSARAEHRPGRAPNRDSGRLAAASAAALVTLAAVLTTVSLIRASPADAVDGVAGATDSGRPAPARVLAAATTMPEAPAALAPSRPVELAVPAIDLETGALIELGRTPAGVPEVPGSARAVGRFAGATTPGERGPAVLTAHADFAHEQGAFYRLGELRPGDRVLVRRADGTGAEFTVYRVETRANGTALTRAVRGNGQPELRLVTASATFDRSFGEHRDAVLAFARLTGVHSADA